MIREQHTIEEWRQIRGLSREAVADACGVTTLTVNNWIKKPSSMRIGYVLKLAQAFDTEVKSIIFLP